MLEAKSEVGKILVMIFHLNLKLSQIQEELDCDKDLTQLSLKYSELIRICSKIIKRVGTVQDEEFCMKRPFVFKDRRYEENAKEGFLYNEMKHLRWKLVQARPQLETLEQLQEVLMPTGQIGQMSNPQSLY